MAALRWLADDSFPETANRSVATAAAVLTLGQIAGPAAIEYPPGFLLVGAADPRTDPIDAIAKHCLGMQAIDPTCPPEGRKMARHALASASKQVELVRSRNLGGTYAFQTSAHLDRARAELLGRGRAGSYSLRHDEVLGWGTDESRHLIARLNQRADRERFLADARSGAPRLVLPTGPDETLRMVECRLSVAGPIAMEDFDGPLVRSILRHALPLLVLPHTVGEAAGEAPSIILMDMSNRIAALAGTPQFSRCPPAHRLPLIPEVIWHYGRIAARAQCFPADYGFFVERTLRGLVNLCERIALMDPAKSVRDEERMSVFRKLCACCFHAVGLGIESLVWHGCGFRCHDPGGMIRLLPVLRRNPVLSKRDLLRKAQWLRSAERDRLLEVFARQKLVKIDGDRIRVTPLGDFIRNNAATIPLRAPDPVPERKRTVKGEKAVVKPQG